MDTTVEDMRTALAQSELDAPEAPAHWGDMRHHVFYGELYHWFVMFRNGEYRKFQRHRELPLVAEAALYTRRLMLMRFIALDRIISTFRIKHGGYPYHIALLQLEHDSSFQMHSPFDRMEDFLALVIEGFAKGAPKHHHLVFKAQPWKTDAALCAASFHDWPKSTVCRPVCTMCVAASWPRFWIMPARP